MFEETRAIVAARSAASSANPITGNMSGMKSKGRSKQHRSHPRRRCRIECAIIGGDEVFYEGYVPANRPELSPKIAPDLSLSLIEPIRLGNVFAESVTSKFFGFVPTAHGNHPTMSFQKRGVAGQPSQAAFRRPKGFCGQGWDWHHVDQVRPA